LADSRGPLPHTRDEAFDKLSPNGAGDRDEGLRYLSPNGMCSARSRMCSDRPGCAQPDPGCAQPERHV